MSLFLLSSYQEYLISACNCSDPNYLSLFNENKQCEYGNDTDCLNNFMLKYLNDVNFLCSRSLCPLECNQTQYSISMSSVYTLGDIYVDYIRSKPNLLSDFDNGEIDIETARVSFVYALIFYDSLSFELSTEYPKMDVISLLAAIGGTCGLFLGVSILSICEIVECLIEIHFIKKKYSKT